MALTKVKLIADGVITSANLDASHGITTSDIGEGSNLYYTDARVSSYLSTNGFATQTDIVAAITDSAPVTLDTLNELAAALGDDPNFATTTATSLGLKAPLASPSFTGNATFAGDITMSKSTSGGLFIKTTSNTEPFIAIQRNSGSNGVAVLRGIDGGHLYIDTGATGAGQSTKMVVQAGGNVGIGSTDADSKLKVEAISGGSVYAGLRVGYAGVSANYYDADTHNIRNGASSLQYVIINSTGVGIGTTSPNARLDVLSTLNVQATGNSDLPYINFSSNGGSFQWGRVGGLLQGDGDGALYFSTKKGGTTAEKMRLNSDGNLGIGITSPSTLLHLLGADATVQIQGSGTSSTAGVNFFPRDGSNVAHLQSIKGVGSNLTFLTGGNSGNSYVPTEKMRITSGGDVLMGGFAANGAISATLNGFGFTSSGTGTAVCNFSDINEMFVFNQRDGIGTTQIDFRNGNVARGYIEWTTSGTSYNTSSDYRLKEDLQDFNGLDKISNISVYDFKWKESQERSYGVIAHELQEVLPQAVSGEKDREKHQQVDYSKIVPLLIKSIQELKADNNNLRERIQTLENQ